MGAQWRTCNTDGRITGADSTGSTRAHDDERITGANERITGADSTGGTRAHTDGRITGADSTGGTRANADERITGADERITERRQHQEPKGACRRENTSHRP